MPDFNINEFNESMFVSFFTKLPPSPRICCRTEYSYGSVEIEVLKGLATFEIEVCEWYMEIRLK